MLKKIELTRKAKGEMKPHIFRGMVSFSITRCDTRVEMNISDIGFQNC